MNVADVSLGAGPAQIARIDRSRNITLNVDLNGSALGDTLAAIEALPSMRNLPDGVRLVPTGDARWIREIFGEFALAMAIGVLSIYAVLVMLFHKFIQPVTILAALPPSAAGAIVALLVFDYSLAINSLIGLLMLMGIVSKNSILIVEYAIMAQRDHGMSRFDSLIDSCSQARAADRHDDDRDDRRHDADRDGLGRRSELPRADGRRRHRRSGRLDRHEPVHRPRDVHGRRRLPAVAVARSAAAPDEDDAQRPCRRRAPSAEAKRPPSLRDANVRARTTLLVVLSVVYIDMLGIGLAFPVLPRLIEQFEGGDVSRASYIYGALAAAYSLVQ